VGDTGELVTLWVVQLLMLVGLFGLMVPVFPGLVVMWVAGLIYGLIAGFGTAGIIIFIVITLLVIAGSVVDNLMMGAGARKGGASWSTIAVAIAAGFLGTLAIPPFGGFVAAPLAILLLEYWRQKDWNKAWVTLKGMVAGWGLSFVMRFIIGLMVMGLWWLWVWVV
jgi:uncharacterized protein YqgC (DUF456 family)